MTRLKMVKVQDLTAENVAKFNSGHNDLIHIPGKQ